MPRGIGIAARCALRTAAPTGVLEFAREEHSTLADFFAVWGQELTPTRMAGFRGRVRAYVSGRVWRGDVRTVPLTPKGQITL